MRRSTSASTAEDQKQKTDRTTSGITVIGYTPNNPFFMDFNAPFRSAAGHLSTTALNQ